MFQTSNGEIKLESDQGAFGKFEHLNFVLVSNFVLRISNLKYSDLRLKDTTTFLTDTN